MAPVPVSDFLYYSQELFFFGCPDESCARNLEIVVLRTKGARLPELQLKAFDAVVGR